MAKTNIITSCLAALALLGLALPPQAAAEGPASAVRTVPMPTRPEVPRLAGRLTAADMGVVINDADPYSIQVGAYYTQRRGIPPSRVLHVTLPLQERLTRAQFDALGQAIEQRFGPKVQALALAWVRPWAVQCQSLNGALALGFDEQLCRRSCGPSRASRYFNAASHRPFKELGLRPSMLLAAADVPAARELIDRGVQADGTQGQRGAPPVPVHLFTTGDAARNVRAPLYPRPEDQRAYQRLGLAPQVQAVADAASAPQPAPALMVQVGLASLDSLPPTPMLPGALADHLTSRGGMLTDPQGQSSALAWLARGATASHGAASEPCNHLQKFPHPQVLLLHYAQGATALEAYWKSVAWPAQSVFIGEPLAAPFIFQPRR